MSGKKTFPTETMRDVVIAVIKYMDAHGGELGYPGYFEVEPEVYAQLCADLDDWQRYGDGPLMKGYGGDPYRPNVLHAGAWITPKQSA